MNAILAAVFNAPLPSLMVVAGLFFLLLAIVSEKVFLLKQADKTRDGLCIMRISLCQ
ncbi:hypothetical protein VU07_01565 [Desulfobulbus sp. F4]|nr:hypothetical protein [Desulfobulbus sp. F3]MCW5200493.1 hypothetical protein [Desulfobulbus sp. F4]